MSSFMEPKGPMILLKAKIAETTTESGIIIATKDEAIRETQGSDIFEVIAMGELAFKDHPQFGSVDPFCQIGDWVMTPRYPGHKFEYPKGTGQFYYLTNDEDIKAVIPRENLSNFNL